MVTFLNQGIHSAQMARNMTIKFVNNYKQSYASSQIGEYFHLRNADLKVLRVHKNFIRLNINVVHPLDIFMIIIFY